MVNRPLTIGILGLQGAVQPHIEKLEYIGVASKQIRWAGELAEIDGIILPGGESTTMIHLLQLNKLWDALADFAKQRPTWGVCAGSILLAREVTHPKQRSFAAIDVTAERNAYGRQNESFIAKVTPTEHWKQDIPMEGVFIRAPKFTTLGPSVTPLLRHGDDVVCCEETNILVTAFHPELSESTALHEYFASKCRSNG